MAYIKHTGIAAHRQVLIINAAVRDGHVIPGERRHLCAERDMFFRKRRVLHALQFKSAKIAEGME